MMNDENVHIVDAYNPYIYPGDSFAKDGIKTQIHVTHHDDDDSYLSKLEKEIPNAIKRFRPDMIIYNAGTDCMENDPLGNLNISPEGIK
jgi:histone deacetylase 11